MSWIVFLSVKSGEGWVLWDALQGFWTSREILNVTGLTTAKVEVSLGPGFINKIYSMYKRKAVVSKNFSIHAASSFPSASRHRVLIQNCCLIVLFLQPKTSSIKAYGSS